VNDGGLPIHTFLSPVRGSQTFYDMDLLTHRRDLLKLAALTFPALAAPGSKWTLIGHRGAVSPKAPENTSQSLEAAIREGYWMAEIDLRATADGSIVLNHDADFSRIYGDSRKVAAASWDGIRGLRSLNANASPILFDQAAEIARDRIGLWLDIKEKPASPAFLAQIEATLRKNHLLERTYVGIHPQATAWFLGKARVAARLEDLFGLAQQGVDISPSYLLADGIGFAMSANTVKWGIGKHVPVVPFVGEWHYPESDPLASGTSDIQQLMKAGVTTFMIDSIYKSLFATA
jgi:hypothetical protein